MAHAVISHGYFTTRKLVTENKTNVELTENKTNVELRPLGLIEDYSC